MTVRSAQLGVGAGTSAGTNTVFTVPAGHRYIVKSVVVYNASATAETDCRIVITLPGGDFSIYKFPSIASTFGAILELWWVFDAGDNFKITQGQNALRWTVSGADLVE